MRVQSLVVLLLLAVGVGRAQDLRRPFDPKNEFGAYVEYANDSSHILIGTEHNRKLLEAGVSYALRLKSNRVASWRWELDVQPLVLLRDPLQTSVDTYTQLVSQIPTGTLFVPPGTYTSTTQTLKECVPSSGSAVFLASAPGSSTPIAYESVTYVNTCADPWTYGGAISPLGQRVNFLPRKRVQPYVAANAGFVAFTKNVPDNNATMFNFSFEFGAGVAYFTRPGRAVTFDARYHHISNAYRGETNPGVDTVLFKLGYSFGR